MIKLPLFGSIRHMKNIGEDPRHQALRERNEARLAALKASNRLYEPKEEKKHDSAPAPRNQNRQFQLAYNQLAAQQSAANGFSNAYGCSCLGGSLGGYHCGSPFCRAGG